MRRDSVIRIVDDDDDEIADGEGTRVPLYLTDQTVFGDGGPHRPGFRMRAAPERQMVRDAYLEMVARAENAWKHPPTRDAGQPGFSTPPGLVAPGSPDPGGDDGVTLRGHLGEGEGERAQRARDRAWSRYRDNLQNAWKTNPRAAVQIERQGERWRGCR